MGRTPYRVKAESIEACNCRHGCNCQFGGYPNEGKCEFIVGYDVKDGHVGNLSLNGLRAVVAAKYPKAIHEGHGHVVLFVDEKAGQDEVDAFATILSGKLGGMPWEALAGTSSGSTGRSESLFRSMLQKRDRAFESLMRSIFSSRRSRIR